jgi:membrane-bound ClpP family serine protease
MDKRNLAFDRTNFILLGIGFAIVVIGFILMSGSSSSEQAFNPDIFSARRIKVAPVVCFVGFVSMIYAIIRKPKDSDNGSAMGVGQDTQVIDSTQQRNA